MGLQSWTQLRATEHACRVLENTSIPQRATQIDKNNVVQTDKDGQ